MGFPVGKSTVALCLEHLTVQSASQIGPTPISVCLENSMMCPRVGKLFDAWGMDRAVSATERVTCPLTMPTCTVDANMMGSP